ncbi:hypothetical protein HPB50_018406 [Hyalomma asiaticum]|uniref:Uncharacterized protein n=1 Tax=Hyalomma asiaticum TaxID=266040 RepID=A0ACB7T6V6_HYAAI|nr:hypothetical protein HPB50_018406 [Hyalomma asiaticum]
MADDNRAVSNHHLGATGAEGSDRTTLAPLRDVAAVSLRLSQYWPADPQLLIAQVNGLSAIARVTPQTQKFSHLVSLLPPEVATELRYVILQPRATDPFDILTSEILLGGEVASFDQGLLRELFLQRLPASVRMVLAAAASLPVSQRINSRGFASGTVDAATAQVSPVLQGLRDELREEICKLSHQITALSTLRQRSSSRGRSFSPCRNSSTLRQGQCWYHRAFGDAA